MADSSGENLVRRILRAAVRQCRRSESPPTEPVEQAAEGYDLEVEVQAALSVVRPYTMLPYRRLVSL